MQMQPRARYSGRHCSAKISMVFDTKSRRHIMTRRFTILREKNKVPFAENSHFNGSEGKLQLLIQKHSKSPYKERRWIKRVTISFSLYFKLIIIIVCKHINKMVSLEFINFLMIIKKKNFKLKNWLRIYHLKSILILFKLL